MTSNHNSTPYRNENFKRDLEEIHATLFEIIEKYGEDKTIHFDKKDDTTGEMVKTPVHTRGVSWSDNKLNVEYRASKFAGNDEIFYGRQASLTVTENYADDEKEVYTLQYFPSTDDAGNITIHLNTKHHQRTSENKKKHDEWWEKNKRPTENGTSHWAMAPMPFENYIQLETEIWLNTIKNGKSLLEKSNN